TFAGLTGVFRPPLVTLLMLTVGGAAGGFTVNDTASLAFASAAAVAVITATPCATAVTRPVVPLTVATAVLLETKVAAWLVELVTTTVICNVCVGFSAGAGLGRSLIVTA